MRVDHARQVELDAFAGEQGWRRGPFRSWKVRGFTISISDREPRRLVVARGGVRETFDSLAGVMKFLKVRRRSGSRAHQPDC